ncbi:CPBP family intramembrane glutamic endopeptidase [Sorangium sp. So ce131]|uniref:CPBP family intramembrane glutamic endopeptidase n=1 Tax=Sorangium sp. So ce131 TaxID=3133282 RepID=UPI003F5E1C2A
MAETASHDDVRSSGPAGGLPDHLPAPRWAWGSWKNISWAFGLVALRMLLFGAVLYGILKPALDRGDERRTGSTPELVQNVILTALSVVFVLAFLHGVARVSWRDLGFSRDRLGRNLALGVGVFAVGLLYIAFRLDNIDTSLGEAWQQVTGYSVRQRVLMLLVGIHVVFGEEVIFRGYLQPALRARFSPAVAIGVTSIIFAAYHADFSPTVFAGIAGWGVIWGIARERSRSTIPSSVAHFLNWAVLGWL